MKKVFALLAISGMVVFYACRNAEKQIPVSDKQTAQDTILIHHLIDSLSKINTTFKVNIVRLIDGKIKLINSCDVSFFNRELLCKGKLNSDDFKKCFTIAVLNNACTMLIVDNKGNAVLFSGNAPEEKTSPADTLSLPLNEVVLSLKEDKVLKINFQLKNQKKEWKIENIPLADVENLLIAERIVCQGPPSKELWACLHKAGIHYQCIIIKNQKDDDGNIIITAYTCS